MKMTMIICGAIPKELLIVINEEKTIKNTPPKATKSPRKEVTKKKVNTPVKAKKTTKKVKKILTKKSK